MPIEQVQRSRSKRKQKQKQNKSQSKISYFFIVFRAYIYGETLLWMYDAVWPFFGRHLERYLSYILLVFVGSFLRPDFFFLFSSFFIYLILLLFECCTYFCFTWVSNLIWYSFFTLNLLSFVFKCAPPPSHFTDSSREYNRTISIFKWWRNVNFEIEFANVYLILFIRYKLRQILF